LNMPYAKFHMKYGIRHMAIEKGSITRNRRPHESVHRSQST
jgi:succinate dehydrogenase/fumarate reductase cytochrome b subunit